MNTCNHQYHVSSPIDTVEVCVKCGHRIGCEPQIPDRPRHTHTWETVQRYFECDEIREYQPEEIPVASTPCPPDPIRTAEIERLISDIAGEDWRGKPAGIKNAIFAARKLAGWKRTDWTK